MKNLEFKKGICKFKGFWIYDNSYFAEKGIMEFNEKTPYWCQGEGRTMKFSSLEKLENYFIKNMFEFPLTGGYSGTKSELPLTIKGNESKNLFGCSENQNTTYIVGIGLYRYGVLVAYGTVRESSHEWWAEYYLTPMEGLETIGVNEINSFMELIEAERNSIRDYYYNR